MLLLLLEGLMVDKLGNSFWVNLLLVFMSLLFHQMFT